MSKWLEMTESQIERLSPGERRRAMRRRAGQCIICGKGAAPSHKSVDCKSQYCYNHKFKIATAISNAKRKRVVGEVTIDKTTLGRNKDGKRYYGKDPERYGNRRG